MGTAEMGTVYKLSPISVLACFLFASTYRPRSDG